MAGMIKVAGGGGGARVAKALDAFALKAEDVTLRRFRMAVWAVFTRLLDTTPQFSGRAVANWNIGVDTPDLTFQDDVGDMDESVSPLGDARKVGDRGWIEYAMANNRPRLKLITSRSRVFISNATRGDAFKGDKRGGPTYYLLDLQDPARWANVLRDENAAAERVADVMLKQSWRRNFHRNTKNTDEEFFKVLG